MLQEIAPSAKRLPARYKAYEMTVEIDGNVYRAVAFTPVRTTIVGKRRSKNSWTLHGMWTIEENKAAIDELINQAGCFVLLTNVPRSGLDGLDSFEVLRTYKGQYDVENDFSFLKEPLVVKDLFLKTPACIDALGMILVLALLITRLMEVYMRRSLKASDETVIGLNEIRTRRPTIYTMTCVVMSIQVLALNHQRILKNHPSDRQNRFLKALGLDHTVFIDPKSKPIIIVSNEAP